VAPYLPELADVRVMADPAGARQDVPCNGDQFDD